jgi:hypothetical protein
MLLGQGDATYSALNPKPKVTQPKQRVQTKQSATQEYTMTGPCVYCDIRNYGLLTRQASPIHQRWFGRALFCHFDSLSEDRFSGREDELLV